MSTITEPRFADERSAEAKSGVSLGQLLRDLIQDLRDLTRGEMDLLKAEVRERFARLEKALILFAVGGAVALAAALTLLYALNMGLTALFATFLPATVAVWLAPLTLAILFAIAGAIVLSNGSKVMRDTDWKPTQTRQSLREGKQWLQSKVR